MGLVKQDEDKIYLTVLSDGTLRQKVQEGTPGAVKREYELRDGTTGSKWELVFKEVEGYVTDISVRDGEFGQSLYVTITWEDGACTLQLNTSLNFGTDMLKKLPGVDFSKPVRVRPYSFTSQDTGKPVRGISLQQPDEDGDWEKVGNFFFDPDTKKTLHGYPEAQGNTKKFSKDDWKIYFLQVKKFLVGYCEQSVIPNVKKVAPKVAPASGGTVAEEGIQFDEEGTGELLAEEEIPF